MEKITDAPLFVYLRPGLVEKSFDVIKQELEVEDMKIITRPVYGLKYIKAPNRDILEFIQTYTSKLTKDYYFVDVSENSRIYINEIDDMFSFMMVSRFSSEYSYRDLI